MPSHSPRLDFPRGLRAVVRFAVIGAVAPVVLMLGFTAIRWLISGTDEFERLDDLRWLAKMMVAPIAGCALVFACAGWATFAPSGGHRFAPTLLIIFLVCIISWFILRSLQLTTPRTKSDGLYPIYPSELAILMGPPIVAAGVLSASRASHPPRKRKGDVLDIDI